MKDASDASPDLGQFFYWREPIEAGHQRVLQDRWNGKWGQGTRQRIMIPGVEQHPGLENRLGEFLNKQGHALRLGEDLFLDLRRECFAASDAFDDCCSLLGG